jgi:hypothetical protein
LEEGGALDDSGIEVCGGFTEAPPETGGTATGGTWTGIGTGTVTGASGTTTTGGGGWTGAVSTGGGPTGAGFGLTPTGSVPPPGAGTGAGPGTGTRAGPDASTTTLTCAGSAGTSVGAAGTAGIVRMGGLVRSGRTISAGALTGTNVTVFLAMTSSVWSPPKKDKERRTPIARGARLCTRSRLPCAADELTGFDSHPSCCPHGSPCCAVDPKLELER